MNKTLKWILGIAGGLLAALALVWTGINIGQMVRYGQGYGSTPYGMMSGLQGTSPDGSTYGYGPGMMGGSGIMGSYSAAGASNVKPLSSDDAKAAIGNYLKAVGNSDLQLKEVLIFDNQAYGLIVEKSTGIGAMEVLVDPITKAVYPEPGPNMMWNQKYSRMGGGGMMSGGGMMGGWRNNPNSSAQMPVSLADAAKAAQSYLDTSLPGTKVEDGGDTFYGYYTLEIMRDGKIAGMLSVNGYNGQVFLHTWHGNFVESSEVN